MFKTKKTHSRLPKMVRVDGKLYSSYTQASKALGLYPSAISYRVRNNIKEDNGHSIIPVRFPPHISYDETEIAKIPSILGIVGSCSPEKKEKPKDCPEFIRVAMAQKIKDLMKEKGIWNEVCEAMEYCGLTKFVITKE